MKVLVVGGSGFIGSHVVDRLCAAGDDVRVYDLRRFPYASGGSVESVVGDILDLQALRVAMRGCDRVVHMAAMADVDAVAASPRAAQEVNAGGTLNVLEAARLARIERVVYASTIWVYGAVPAADEDTPLPPPAHIYTATKMAGELYCHSYGSLYGSCWTILRLGIPYGPRARPRGVVPSFVQRAAAGLPLSIAGDGGQSRRFVYVEDLADGIVHGLAPAAANRVYNLVGAESSTVLDVADAVARCVGPVHFEFTPARAGDLASTEVSGERAARELGWRPTTGLDEGVRRYVAWLELADGLAREDTAT